MRSKLAALCTDCKHVSGDCHVGLQYSLPLNPSYKCYLSLTEAHSWQSMRFILCHTWPGVWIREFMFPVMHWAVGILHGGREYSLAAASGHNFAFAMHCQRGWRQVYINEPLYHSSAKNQFVTNVKCARKERQQIVHINPICWQITLTFDFQSYRQSAAKKKEVICQETKGVLCHTRMFLGGKIFESGR